MPFVTAVKIEESEMEEGQSRKDFSENSAERNASGEAASQQSLSEKIAMEISNAEEREKEVEKKQSILTAVSLKNRIMILLPHQSFPVPHFKTKTNNQTKKFL